MLAIKQRKLEPQGSLKFLSELADPGDSFVLAALVGKR